MEDDDHLDADPAAAFDRLSGEVSLLRSVIEELTAAREPIEIPDYEPTLERTEKILGALVHRIDGLSKKPAMSLTPETMGARLNVSVMEALSTVHSHTRASTSALDGAVSELRTLVQSARHANAQKRRTWLFGGAGVLLGLVLCAGLAGPIVRLAPDHWLWPERLAAWIVAQPTPWDAGVHIIAQASPADWERLVAAEALMNDNAEAIAKCREASTEAKKAVRCTISMKP